MDPIGIVAFVATLTQEITLATSSVRARFENTPLLSGQLQALQNELEQARLLIYKLTRHLPPLGHDFLCPRESDGTASLETELRAMGDELRKIQTELKNLQDSTERSKALGWLYRTGWSSRLVSHRVRSLRAWYVLTLHGVFVSNISLALQA